MNPRTKLAAVLTGIPGLLNNGFAGVPPLPGRAKRHAQQTMMQRELAIARAEVKRARKRAKRLANRDGGSR